MHRRRGAALNPGPGQLLPPSFPTTHMWCDRYRVHADFQRHRRRPSVSIGRAMRSYPFLHGGMDTTASRDLSKRKAVADDAGNLHVPDTYRTTYELLGSWAVAADQGQGSKQLHVVYASPATIAAYRTDGRFPDGAVLVKEVFKAATGQMTTGTV